MNCTVQHTIDGFTANCSLPQTLEKEHLLYVQNILLIFIVISTFVLVLFKLSNVLKRATLVSGIELQMEDIPLFNRMNQQRYQSMPSQL